MRHGGASGPCHSWLSSAPPAMAQSVVPLPQRERETHTGAALPPWGFLGVGSHRPPSAAHLFARETGKSLAKSLWSPDVQERRRHAQTVQWDTRVCAHGSSRVRRLRVLHTQLTERSLLVSSFYSRGKRTRTHPACDEEPPLPTVQGVFQSERSVNPADSPRQK